MNVENDINRSGILILIIAAISLYLLIAGADESRRRDREKHNEETQ